MVTLPWDHPTRPPRGNILGKGGSTMASVRSRRRHRCHHAAPTSAGRRRRCLPRSGPDPGWSDRKAAVRQTGGGRNATARSASPPPSGVRDRTLVGGRRHRSDMNRIPSRRWTLRTSDVTRPTILMDSKGPSESSHLHDRTMLNPGRGGSPTVGRLLWRRSREWKPQCSTCMRRCGIPMGRSARRRFENRGACLPAVTSQGRRNR